MGAEWGVGWSNSICTWFKHHNLFFPCTHINTYFFLHLNLWLLVLKTVPTVNFSNYLSHIKNISKGGLFALWPNRSNRATITFHCQCRHLQLQWLWFKILQFFPSITLIPGNLKNKTDGLLSKIKKNNSSISCRGLLLNYLFSVKSHLTFLKSCSIKYSQTTYSMYKNTCTQIMAIKGYGGEESDPMQPILMKFESEI